MRILLRKCVFTIYFFITQLLDQRKKKIENRTLKFDDHHICTFSKNKNKTFPVALNWFSFKSFIIACHLPCIFFHFETIIVTTTAQLHNLNECRICKRTAVHKELKKGRNFYMRKRFVAIALLFLLTNTSKNCYAKEVSTLKFELNWKRWQDYFHYFERT